jgi:hypothetical protein
MLARVLAYLVSVAWGGVPAQERSTHALDAEVSSDAALACFHEESVLAGIAETLGMDLARGPADARANVVVERVESGWNVDIVVRGASASLERHRELEVIEPSCEELLHTVTLIVALLLDEIWAEERTLRVEHPEPPKPAPASPEAPPAEPWAVYSGLLGAMSVGELPTVAGGTGLRVEFAAPRVLSFGFGTTAWPRSVAHGEGDERARFAAVEGAVFLCPRVLERPRFVLSPCAGTRVGFVYVVGSGFDEDVSTARPRWLGDAELGGRVRLGGPVWLRIGIGASVPLVRDTFLARDGDQSREIHRAWPVVPTASMALELRSELARRKRAGIRKSRAALHLLDGGSPSRGAGSVASR